MLIINNMDPPEYNIDSLEFLMTSSDGELITSKRHIHYPDM